MIIFFSNVLIEDGLVDETKHLRIFRENYTQKKKKILSGKANLVFHPLQNFESENILHIQPQVVPKVLS